MVTSLGICHSAHLSTAKRGGFRRTGEAFTPMLAQLLALSRPPHARVVIGVDEGRDSGLSPEQRRNIDLKDVAARARHEHCEDAGLIDRFCVEALTGRRDDAPRPIQGERVGNDDWLSILSFAPCQTMSSSRAVAGGLLHT